MSDFEFSIEGGTSNAVLLLSGKIDEDANLESAIGSIENNFVTIDLSKIVALNSYGVRVWINAFTKFSDREFLFRKVPSVIINQINMISNFLPKNSRIESYYAPYYCEECDVEEDVLYYTDEGPFSIKEEICKKCGSELEFDELEDEYFLFLNNIKKVKKVENSIDKIDTNNYDLIVAIENKREFSKKLAEQISKMGYIVKNLELKGKNSEELVRNINDNIKLVVCGYQNTDESLIEIENLKKKFSQLKIVMLTEDKLKKILVEDWIHSFYPDNIITFEYENLDKDLNEINTVIDKILSNEIFGMDRYLSDDSIIKEIIIKSAKDKQAYLSEIIEFAEEHKVRKRILSSIEQIADELILNAIYNAPLDEKGKDKYKMVIRSEKIDLQEDEYALLKYGIDNNKFVISVTDYFGRLTKDKVLGYLHKCFSDTNFRVSEDSGGAGLGLYIIYSKVQQFVINIKPNVKTEVITSFNLNRKSKDVQDKMFHIFIN